MIYLLRSIENREGGSFEHRDNEQSGDEISVGRATDQDIQLPESEVGFQHALIRLRGKGRAHISALSPANAVSVNDKIVRRAALRPGDVVRIGGSVLEVIAPPAGFDFALTLERAKPGGDMDAAPVGSQYVTSLAGTGLRKRFWSWTFFIVILFAFLVIPASGLFSPRLQAMLRSSPLLPDDGVWTAGPLIAAHSIPEVGDHCEVCHVRPFVKVSDEQCTACHNAMGEHPVQEASK
ncbi:MAG: FHA domain-containing protein [Arenicellales bacterium]